jgi:hypothetical protein
MHGEEKETVIASTDLRSIQIISSVYDDSCDYLYSLED